MIEELFLRAGGAGPTFRPLAAWYAPRGALALTEQELRSLNHRFNASFDQTLTEILDGRQVTGFTRALTVREANLVVAYGIRNRSAHGLVRPPAVATEFDRLVPRLFYGAFAALEALYP